MAWYGYDYGAARLLQRRERIQRIKQHRHGAILRRCRSPGPYLDSIASLGILLHQLPKLFRVDGGHLMLHCARFRSVSRNDIGVALAFLPLIVGLFLAFPRWSCCPI